MTWSRFVNVTVSCRDGVVPATMSCRHHSEIEHHVRLIDGNVVDHVTYLYDPRDHDYLYNPRDLPLRPDTNEHITIVTQPPYAAAHYR